MRESCFFSKRNRHRRTYGGGNARRDEADGSSRCVWCIEVGGIICRDENGTKYWYHYDRLGNVVAVTNFYGSVASLYTMDAFGNVLEKGNGGYLYEHTTDPQPYHLTTKEYDPDARLYYFNARWYDPETGRWVSRELFHGDSQNSYLFNFNNPANWFDWDGYNSVFDEAKRWLCEMWSDYLGEWEMPGPFGNPHDPGWWPPSEKWGDPLALERKHPGPGTTAGRVCFGIAGAATAAAIIVGILELTVGNTSTTILGPSVRNGRIIGIRNPNWWEGCPLHLDYHPIRGSDGCPVIHLNTPRGKHIPFLSLKWLKRLLEGCK